MPFFDQIYRVSKSLLAYIPLSNVNYSLSMIGITSATAYNYKNIPLNGFVTTFVSITSGVSMKWSIFNGCITIVDDLMAEYNITANHYFSNIALSIGLLKTSQVLDNVSKATQIYTGLATIVGTATMTYYANYDVVQPYRDATTGLYNNYKDLMEFLPDENLQSSVYSFLLSSVISQMIFKSFTQSISNKCNSALHRGWSQVVDNPVEALNNGINLPLSFIAQYAGSLSAQLVLQYAMNSIINYYWADMTNKITTSITHKIITQDNIFKVIYDESTMNLIHKIPSLASDIVNYSGGNLFHGTSAIVSVLAAIESLSHYSYASMFSFIILNNFLQIWNKSLRNDREKVEQKMSNISQNIDNQIHDFSSNMRSIAERGGIEFTKNSLLEKMSILEELKYQSNNNQLKHDTIHTIYDYLDTFLLYGLGGYFHYNCIKNLINNPAQVIMTEEQKDQLIFFANQNTFGLNNLHIFLEWSQSENHNYKIALNSFKEILKAIEAKNSNNFQIEQNNENYLGIKNLTVGVADRVLIKQSDDIELPLGSVIELNGESGTGKSTLLTIIQKIHSIPFIYGAATISYPKINDKSIDIIMVTQKEYFVPQSSLLEAITFPVNVLDSQLSCVQTAVGKILALLEGADYHHIAALQKNEYNIENSSEGNANADSEVNMSEKVYGIQPLFNRLNETQYDWNGALSGGQKKKITCASVMFKVLSANIFELQNIYGHDINLYEEKLNTFFDNPENIIPHIVILDEPLNGLDSNAALNLMRTVKKFCYNSLIIMVDHNSKEHNELMQKADHRNFFDHHMRIINQDIIFQKHEKDNEDTIEINESLKGIQSKAEYEMSFETQYNSFCNKHFHDLETLNLYSSVCNPIN